MIMDRLHKNSLEDVCGLSIACLYNLKMSLNLIAYLFICILHSSTKSYIIYKKFFLIICSLSIQYTRPHN